MDVFEGYQNRADLFAACESEEPTRIRQQLALVYSSSILVMLNDRGRSVLHIAASSGNAVAVELIIERLKQLAAGSNLTDSLNTKTRFSGSTPLLLAAQNGFDTVVDLLIRAGANVDQPVRDHATPLYMAAQNNHVKVTELLVKAGANISATRDDGATPLFTASYNGHLDIVHLLVANGAIVDHEREDKATALHVAAYHGHHDVVKVLIVNGANVLSTFRDGAFALYVSCQEGHLDIVRLLMSSGADPQQRKTDGSTIVGVAAHKNHVEILRYLFEECGLITSINTPSCEGRGPLHWAAFGGSSEATHYLLSMGADPFARTATNTDLGGLTALAMAREKLHHKCAKILMQPKWYSLRNHCCVAIRRAAQNTHLNYADYYVPICLDGDDDETDDPDSMLLSDPQI
jgi:ankyrin repeat protein